MEGTKAGELLRRASVFDSFSLKSIAILCMAADHTGRVLFPGEESWICVGRLAFPIFAFLLTEGFFHTRDIYRYLVRLGIFAVLSEIPFYLAFFQTCWYPRRQNVFFTLFISVALMAVLERSREWPERILEIYIAMWAAEALGTDYGFRGVLLVLVFYVGRMRPFAGLALAGLWNFLWQSSVQRFGALAVIPIGLYNGKKGRSLKYFFYVFYPAHLLLLCMLRDLR